MNTPPVPDGPDTELAAANYALSYLDAYARSRDHAHSGDARRWVEAVRAALARPAAGRDLTVFDFMDAVQLGSGEAAAEHLNRIARPSGGVGQSDAAEEEDAQMLRSVDTDPLRSALLDAVGGFTFRGSPVGDARRLADVVLGVVLTEDWRPVRGRQVPADPSPRSWSLPDPPPDDVTDVEDGPTAVELLDALEGMGAALVEIGIALGLPRPSGIARWGAPEILARFATLNSELKVPPRATARIAQARADQAEGYGSTTSTVEGLLRELDRRGGELVRLRAACARPAVARTDGQPDPDPHGRYDVPDAYDHPGWPLVSRIVAIATDTDPTMPDETDGVDNAVTGLLAAQSWRDHVAMADVMGLVGDWGTDDVVQAVTDALHEYPRLRARVARTDGCPTPCDDDCEAGCHETHEVPAKRAHDVEACLLGRRAIAVAASRTDGQPPAEGLDPLAHVQPGHAADDMLCGDQHGPWNCTRDLQHPGQHIASIGHGQRVGAVWPAAPADDTAAPDAPWMVESRDERVDRLTRHVENVADCAGIEIEVREAGPLTGPAPLRRLVRALEGAGMLHDDPADDTAAPGPERDALRRLMAARELAAEAIDERARAATGKGRYTAQEYVEMDGAAALAESIIAALDGAS